MPDYDAIRLFHRVETIYSDSETHRRLEEVRIRLIPTIHDARPWPARSTGNRTA